MCEPTLAPARRRDDALHCDRCDLLVGLDGLHVIGVERSDIGLTVTVATPPRPGGCSVCGVVAVSHGRRKVTLVDTRYFGRLVTLVWLKRTWCCAEPARDGNGFTEAHPEVAQTRMLPLLKAMAADVTRFDGVERLGVDEHLWHQVSPLPEARGGWGPKELTGMVDLTPGPDGKPKARLLDLIPGRSGKAYGDWLEERGPASRGKVKEATLDPFHGYKNAIDEHLEDATAILDAFHVVKLGTAALDEVRRRVQQETTGHRGRRGDPLYGIRNIPRAGAEHLTDCQQGCLATAIAADERHEEVHIAWQAAQRLRSAYTADNLNVGKRVAQQLIGALGTCPIPELARLVKTLRRWFAPFLAYFTTGRANNGRTEAINRLIELHRRITRGFRNRHNYRLRMLLIGGGLTSPHLG